MRFNYDLLPGERLTFDEIARRYALQYPDDKELTARALLFLRRKRATVRWRTCCSSPMTTSVKIICVALSTTLSRISLSSISVAVRTRSAKTCGR